MLKIRLKRVGRKHDPSFRIVVTEKHLGPKSGKYIENLGFYDSRKDIKEVKADRVKYWISVGAQVSDTVHNILVSKKIIEGKKINVLPRKSPIVKQEEKTDTGPASQTEGTSQSAGGADKPSDDGVQPKDTDEGSMDADKVEEKKEETPAKEIIKEKTESTPEPEEKEPFDTARGDSEESKPKDPA